MEECLNIVVPMAGRGSRFRDAGFTEPKPLIPVGGMPMIELVIRNLTPRQPHRFVFVCQQDHVDRYDLMERLRSWAPDCEVVGLEGYTDGAARTVLLTRDHIDSDDPLMIANSDQFVDYDINRYLGAMLAGRDLGGLIMTMQADDPKWSYVELTGAGLATRVVEKEVVSDCATVGIYNFRRGKDFVRAAEQMIHRDLRVNGECYVAPVYNLMIEEGARIGVHSVGTVGDGMYGLGTPDDLQMFLDQQVLKPSLRRAAQPPERPVS